MCEAQFGPRSFYNIHILPMSHDHTLFPTQDQLFSSNTSDFAIERLGKRKSYMDVVRSVTFVPDASREHLMQKLELFTTHH